MANSKQTVSAIAKGPAGNYMGTLYVAIAGLPQGHLHLECASLEALQGLAEGLATFLQTQSRVIQVQALPGVKPQ